jgi:hypothetical protein
MRKLLTLVMMIALFSVMGLSIAATDEPVSSEPGDDPIVLIAEEPKGEVVEPDPDGSVDEEPGFVEGSEGESKGEDVLDGVIITDPLERPVDPEPWYRTDENGEEIVNPCGEGIEMCIFTSAPTETNDQAESSNDILKMMFGEGVNFTPKFDMNTVALSVGAMSVGLIIIAFVNYMKANKKH